jgi:hypothetical protein
LCYWMQFTTTECETESTRFQKAQDRFFGFDFQALLSFSF